MNWGDFHRCRWLVGLSAVGFASGLAPAIRAEEPDWFKLNGLPEVSLGVEAETSTEQTKVSGGSSTYEYSSITPLVGLHTTGSIYHPNLLRFDLSGDLGWGWDSMTSSSSGSSQTRDESAELLRYLAEINLFAEKPCNASVFAAQDHSYRDYGTFNTYTVDATRYGGRMNWTEGAFTLNADLGYRNETDSGLTDSTELTQAYLNFLGIHQRKSGETTLSLHVDNLENKFNSAANSLETRSWSLGVSDSEAFGYRKQFNASSGLTYSQSDYAGQQMDTLNVSENLTANHRPNLDSYLLMNFNQNELRPITATQLQGTAGVRHQLYESLTSTLEAHGTHQENSADTGHSTFDQYGLRLSENYTKRLQSWGRLAAGVGTGVDHQDQDSPVGLQTWFEEPHQIYQTTSPNYQKQFLVHPRVNNVIEVKAGNYVLPTGDYQVSGAGEFTEILLVSLPSGPTASLMTNGSLAVTITYQSESLGTSSYDTFNANAQIRLDLFNRLGIYSRVNWLGDNAPPEVLAQTLTELVGGVDYNYKWFRTGAEYENYDSNFTRYQALRFFQNFDFTLSAASSLSFDFYQSFYSYPDSGDQSQYQFTTRYNARLPMALTWYVEGGAMIQEMAGMEQTQGMARTGLGWRRGKVSLRVGYEFNSQTTASGGFSDQLIKHRFFAYLRRSF